MESQNCAWADMHEAVLMHKSLLNVFRLTKSLLELAKGKQLFLVKEFSECESSCFSSSSQTKAFSSGWSDSESLSFRPCVDNFLHVSMERKLSQKISMKKLLMFFSVWLQFVQWEDFLQRQRSFSEEIWTLSG